jgi:hypothetical protein
MTLVYVCSSNCLLFPDVGCHILQSDIDSVLKWSVGNGMQSGGDGTTFISVASKTDSIDYECKLASKLFARSHYVEDRKYWLDCNLCFHSHIGRIFESIKIPRVVDFTSITSLCRVLFYYAPVSSFILLRPCADFYFITSLCRVLFYYVPVSSFILLHPCVKFYFITSLRRVLFYYVPVSSFILSRSFVKFYFITSLCRVLFYCVLVSNFVLCCAIVWSELQ